MQVSSSAIENGVIADRYGSKGAQFRDGMPSLSIPFEVIGAPEGTRSFAVVFDDYDAVPVCGFDWIHWLVCDLKRPSVAEGESGKSKDFTEGCNSWHSVADELTVSQATGYGGPAPPDREHRYTLKVYALDSELGLPRGFMMNDLYFAMRGHVLAHATLIGKYSPKRRSYNISSRSPGGQSGERPSSSSGGAEKQFTRAGARVNPFFSSRAIVFLLFSPPCGAVSKAVRSGASALYQTPHILRICPRSSSTTARAGSSCRSSSSSM